MTDFNVLKNYTIVLLKCVYNLKYKNVFYMIKLLCIVIYRDMFSGL